MSCKVAAILPLGAAFMVSLLVGAGCVTGAGPNRGIDSLHLFSVPVALDLDGLPGPDGFGVTLYASAAAKAKGVPVAKGTMEILMFDGVLEAGVKANAAPRRVWSYSPADLKNFVIKSSLGTGYRITPRWGDTPPRESRISIVARLVSANRSSIQSVPTTISVSSK